MSRCKPTTNIQTYREPATGSFSRILCSRMPRHSCCEMRVMQCMTYFFCASLQSCRRLYQMGGLTPTTDTDLLLATYRSGSHFTSDIFIVSVFLFRHLFRVSRYEKRNQPLLISFFTLYNFSSLDSLCSTVFYSYC